MNSAKPALAKMTTAHAPLSNPKPLKSSNANASCWYRFYAMFSERFADEVLTEAGLAPGSVVLDPWLGVGTTTAIAARKGLRGVGIDLNPVMVAIAKGWSISQTDATEAQEAALKLSRRTEFVEPLENDPLRHWFGPVACTELRSWQRLIRGQYPDDRTAGQAGFLMTSLFETARTLAKGFRSKNPTWVKKPEAGDRIECPRGAITRTFLDLAKHKVAACHPELTHPAEIRRGTSTQLPLPNSHADFVLTSPPYCTRIDYAVTTRIEMAVMNDDPNAVDNLRDQMMGTSTIRQRPLAPSDKWGPICSEFLTHVLGHPSKASNNYYYKTFVQYFGDLYSSLSEIHRCTKPGAGVVIVVQDSHYKGTKADLALITAEMAGTMGWGLVRRDDYRVAQTMRRVNTRSRKYRPDATAQETVLWFRKPD